MFEDQFLTIMPHLQRNSTCAVCQPQVCACMHLRSPQFCWYREGRRVFLLKLINYSVAVWRF